MGDRTVQTGLFGGPKGHADGRVEIPLRDAEPLVLWRGWGGTANQAELNELRDDIAWEQHEVSTPAGRIRAPRLESFYATNMLASYSYSGERYRARKLEDNILLCLLNDQVSRATGDVRETRWNAVFCNLYRDGMDSIGWHADDEVESLGPTEDVRIASVSFGRRRPFAIKSKTTDERVTLDLGEGDLLLMGRRTQSAYLHCVPKRPSHETARLNLTFRRLVY